MIDNALSTLQALEKDIRKHIEKEVVSKAFEKETNFKIVKISGKGKKEKSKRK